MLSTLCFLKIVLALLGSYDSMRILGFFSSVSVKSASGILIGIVWNRPIALGSGQ